MTLNTVIVIVVLISIFGQLALIMYLRRKNMPNSNAAKGKADLIDKEFSKQIGDEQ